MQSPTNDLADVSYYTDRAQRVYLDNNATTPHSPELRRRWAELMDISGNPSSIHQDSRIAKTILRETKQKIADFLGCSPLEVVFNSGASEGNSSILRAVFELSGNEKKEFLISQVEHPSVLKTAAYLEAHGAVIHYIPVNKDGVIDINFIKEKLSKKIALVSVMYANNETGTVFPIKEISSLAHAAGVLMHSDCVQMLGKVKINFAELNLDYATFSAHKVYSMKGTGFCFIKKSAPWVPLIPGGGQERGRRGGTENVTGIAAFNIVMDQLYTGGEKISEMLRIRNLMEELILEKISSVHITAKNGERICNTSSLVIAGVDGETLLINLDLKGYSVSTGAACSSGNPEPSPALLAMGLTRLEAQNSLRISIGWQTTEQQIVQFVQTLSSTVTKLRNINDKFRDEVSMEMNREMNEN